MLECWRIRERKKLKRREPVAVRRKEMWFPAYEAVI
jgi:hypothetical protein